MTHTNITYTHICKVFMKTGATAFGGWSTTALLLERELADKLQLIAPAQIKKASTYAQIIPGATQVAIVSQIGYKLRGFYGALIATISYLFPAVSLITLFASIYFHYASSAVDIKQLLDGLVAALSGIILANAYKIGSKHSTKFWLWILVALAFTAKLAFGINALIIILVYGITGLAVSYIQSTKALK